MAFDKWMFEKSHSIRSDSVLPPYPLSIERMKFW